MRHDVSKSDVNVPHRSEAEIDFIASDPGLSLFHRHATAHGLRVQMPGRLHLEPLSRRLARYGNPTYAD